MFLENLVQNLLQAIFGIWNGVRIIYIKMIPTMVQAY